MEKTAREFDAMLAEIRGGGRRLRRARKKKPAVVRSAAPLAPVHEKESVKVEAVGEVLHELPAEDAFAALTLPGTALRDRLLEERLEKNMGYVVFTARKWLQPGVLMEDLLQEGRLGIMTAHERYEEGRGANFLSYARWHIMQRISRYVKEHRDTIRVPEGKFGKVRCFALSLDAPLSDDSCDTLGDVVGAIPADEQLHEQSDVVQLVNRAMKKLQPVERRVLQARFIEELTLEEVGGELKLTRERIRQIQNNALAKLRRDRHLKQAA